MNKFVKKNLVLVAVLSVTGIVSIGLLITAGLIYFNLRGRIAITRETSEKISKINQQRPAPSEENEQIIKSDIAHYEKAVGFLKSSFSTPMQPAVDTFIQVLSAPKAEKLNEEEYERYRVKSPKENEMSEEELAKLPKKAKKLSLAEFKEFCKNRFEREYGEDNRKDSLATHNIFIDEFSSCFVNWNEALKAFVEKAKTLTSEPIDPTNDDAMLLAAMGFPRPVPNIVAFTRHMDDYRQVLARSVSGKEVELMSDVLQFMLATDKNGNQVGANYAVADMREIFFQWDVLGDIIKRIVDSKVRIFCNIRARNFAENPEEGRVLGNYSESVGSYKLYHYTVEISGNLESIRAFCKNLDTAYKTSRPYIVRAVTLYAEENGAAVLMEQNIASQKDNNSQSDSGNGGRRGRRRRAVEAAADDESNKESATLTQQQEEAQNTGPVELRPGYGRILVGAGELFRAMVDFDYVVREQNQ